MNRKTTFLAILVLLAISLQFLTGSSVIADSVIAWGGQAYDSSDFPLTDVIAISTRV